MRRLWAAGAAIVVCLAISGMPVAAQAESTETPAAPGASAATLTVGFTNYFTGNDFFDKIAQGAQEAADAAGVTLLVEDAGGNPTTQARQVEGFIADGVDAIIIVPADPDAIGAAVEAANAAGIPVLAVDRTANGGMVTSLIASDNAAGGRMAGEFLFEAMSGSGKVIEVQGDFASASTGRAEGFGQALDAAPGITLVGQGPAYGDPAMAAAVTGAFLETDADITGLFAHNDDMALGAIQAVADAGMVGQVMVVGFDASPGGLAAIEAGTMAGTIAQQPLLMGQVAVETAVAAASGQPVEPFVPIETMLVTRDNVDQFQAGEAGAAGAAQSEEPDQGTTWPRLTMLHEYGDDAKQIIQAYELEPRAEPRPAVVFFHGGGLIMGQPMMDAAPAKWVAELGFVTFMAGYRLYVPSSGANAWPTQLDDAQRAIRWVRAHADEFNVDLERVCATGYSAGGYLVGLLGTLDTRDDSDRDLAGFSSRPDCVFMGAGDGDLTVPYPEQYLDGVLVGDLMAGWLGGTIEEMPEAWEAASPAHNIDADTPPFLVIHGSEDEYTPVEMSRNFVAAMREAGRDVEYLELPGGHMEVPSHPEFLPTVERFLVDRMHPEQ